MHPSFSKRSPLLQDFEIDSEDVNGAQSFSQSAAKQASSPSLLKSGQDNINEDEIINILNKAPPMAMEQEQSQFGSLKKPADKSETLRAKESPPPEGQQQILAEESAAAGEPPEEMECEVSAEEKVEEEENTTVDIINSKAAADAATITEATLDDAQEKQASSDDDLSSLFGEDEAMVEALPEKTAPTAATPTCAAPSNEREALTPPSNPSPPKELSSFQFPALNSSKRLPNNNRPRIPSRLGPGRSPPLPESAAAPPTEPVHAAKAAIKNINESFSPLFPSAATKSPNLGGGAAAAAAAGTPTPITPAGELEERNGAAITPGTASPLRSPTTVEKAAPTAAKAVAAAATPQTAAAASPAATPPRGPPAAAAAAAALGINDGLLKIDFSARGDKFLSSLEDEEAATQGALATPTAKKVFSLSTSVATAGVETESLSRKLEELDVNLTMTRLKYALDTVEATVMGAILLGSGIGKENNSEGGGSCYNIGNGSAATDADAAAATSGLVNEEEAMDIDIV